RPVVSRAQGRGRELLAAERHTAGMAFADVREVAIVVRCADDSPNDDGRARQPRASERDHSQSPATATRGWNGASLDSAGLRPCRTAAHSRMLSARMTTTEIMKNAATPASR